MPNSAMIIEKESTTGIALPSVIQSEDPEEFATLLDDVAHFCTRHLSSGGYFSDEEAKAMLGGYRAARASGRAIEIQDFLAFTAHDRGKRCGLAPADEIRRMQKVLRWGATDKVPFWAFGPLPGKSEGLFQVCPSLEIICRGLCCPARVAGDSSIIHVASVNPVAALITAALIEREMAALPGGLIPFVFPLMVDLPTWQVLLQRHPDL
jgi:hypothetical protein